MTMPAKSLFDELRNKLIGQKITSTRLAANSLILYINSQPGDNQGYAIWFEPTWHMSAPTGILIGSRQAQGTGPEGATSEELDQIGAPLKQLISREISELDIDDRACDLTVSIDKFLIRTFAADPDDDHSWHISDNENKIALLYGSPAGLSIHAKKF